MRPSATLGRGSHGVIDAKDSALGLAPTKAQAAVWRVFSSPSQSASVTWSWGSWDRRSGGWVAGSWGQLCVTLPQGMAASF